MFEIIFSTKIPKRGECHRTVAVRSRTAPARFFEHAVRFEMHRKITARSPYGVRTTPARCLLIFIIIQYWGSSLTSKRQLTIAVGNMSSWKRQKKKQQQKKQKQQRGKARVKSSRFKWKMKVIIQVTIWLAFPKHFRLHSQKSLEITMGLLHQFLHESVMYCPRISVSSNHGFTNRVLLCRRASTSSFTKSAAIHVAYEFVLTLNRLFY